MNTDTMNNKVPMKVGDKVLVKGIVNMIDNDGLTSVMFKQNSRNLNPVWVDNSDIVPSGLSLESVMKVIGNRYNYVDTLEIRKDLEALSAPQPEPEHEWKVGDIAAVIAGNGREFVVHEVRDEELVENVSPTKFASERIVYRKSDCRFISHPAPVESEVSRLDYLEQRVAKLESRETKMLELISGCVSGISKLTELK